jgi:hypothetical protein
MRAFDGREAGEFARRIEMLRRAWFVFAALWALLIFWLASYDAEIADSLHVWIIALGPFAAPWLLATFFRFVITGSPFKPPRATPYRRP